ncbi:hypothetical protein ACVI1J_002798 [Bradyrhizobium diazoefficiens]
MTEYLIRFLIGGAVVSAFSMLGDVLKPKSFAGLFGAAPSVALATLGIAIYEHGAVYAGAQSLSMMAGAVALVVYSILVCQLLMRARMRALPATIVSIVVWLGAAFGLWALAGGGTREASDEGLALVAAGRVVVRILGAFRPSTHFSWNVSRDSRSG